MSHPPVNELENPLKETAPADRSSGFKRCLKHWDGLLLAGLFAFMLGSGAYLLWPQPQAEISLHPFHAPASGVVLTSSVEDSESPTGEITPAAVESAAFTGSASAEKPRRQSRKRFSSHKKPTHPPVLDLNRATITQLQLLPGIGPKTAVLIIEYRKAHGPFASSEQIMDVKGIGPKKFAKMKAFLKV